MKVRPAFVTLGLVVVAVAVAVHLAQNSWGWFPWI